MFLDESERTCETMLMISWGVKFVNIRRGRFAEKCPTKTFTDLTLSSLNLPYLPSKVKYQSNSKKQYNYSTKLMLAI